MTGTLTLAAAQVRSLDPLYPSSTLYPASTQYPSPGPGLVAASTGALTVTAAPVGSLTLTAA